MAIAQPTDNVDRSAGDLATTISTRTAGLRSRILDSASTGGGAGGTTDGSVQTATAAGGNGGGALAPNFPTPPGWRPIELDLPVPGNQTPYHINAPTPNDLRPAFQGYGQAVRTGVQGMIPNLPQMPNGPQAPQLPSQMPSQVSSWLQPFLHSLFSYLQQNHQATTQPVPPTGGGQPVQTPFGNPANLPPQVRQILGL